MFCLRELQRPDLDRIYKICEVEVGRAADCPRFY
jgi:hypothetical protein